MGNHKKQPRKMPLLKFPFESAPEDEWDYYYDAMVAVGDGDLKTGEKLLRKVVALSPDFPGGYEGFAMVAYMRGNKAEEKKFIDLAFEKVKKQFPRWPQKMSWYILENRPTMRVIQMKASQYQIDGEAKEADELYRLLLRMHPNDNQGIRYLIAGMYAGFMPDDINDMFDEGNKKQDWSRLEKLVATENKKHHFWKPPKLK